MRRDECVCVMRQKQREGQTGRGNEKGGEGGRVPVLDAFISKVNSICAFFYWVS